MAAILVGALLASAADSPAQTAPLLTVRVVGDGKVTSTPRGTDCPPACTAPYPLDSRRQPQAVVLSATPAAGQQLESWGEACSGTGTCTVVMNGAKVVSARFGPAPPLPQPTPPGMQPLTVAVTAGGSVTATGIACPGICVGFYAPGTVVALQATAAPGYDFAGWDGACSGAATCGPAIAGPTFVKAAFAPTPPPRPLGTAGGDSDRDGVLNAADACPGTPQGVKLRANGCAALDAVLHGAGLLAPLHETIVAARGGLRNVPGLGGAGRQLASGLRRIEQGAADAATGDVCPGARRVRAGLRTVKGAAQSAAKLIEGLQAKVMAEQLAPAFGDTADKDLRWAELHLRLRLVDGAVGDATDVQKAYGAACAGLGPKTIVRGRITKVDDAAGVLWLGSERFLLPRRRFGNRIAEQGVVKLVARKVKGGPDLVTSVTPQAASASADTLSKVPCMKLRIAPAQDFEQPSPILHDLRGYQANGRLWLERGARLAASPKCAGATGRYSLAMELVFGELVVPVADDLSTDDPPLALPPVSTGKVWTLVVHERRQGSNCPPTGPSKPARAAAALPCPVVEVGKTDYPTQILYQGAYATAVYDKTVFGLDVDAPAPAIVAGVMDKHSSLPASVAFEGEGFKPTGNQATGSIVPVKEGETWALWPKVFYGFDGVVSPLQSFGVDHYAGLLWPRVVGTRAGKPFRYSASLPKLVTDRLASCFGDVTDCFYSAPWSFDVQKNVNQGNGPGAFSHNGNQQYAFDFGLVDGDEIRAARGGVVGDVVDNLTLNYNPCDPDTPNADGPGNYVRIDHQDGTYAYYVHLKPNTVPLTAGQEVGRSALVGQADNTGRSCGAHLHFQVSIVKTKKYYGQTTPIRFETWVAGQGPYALECYLPVTDDDLISTTG